MMAAQREEKSSKSFKISTRIVAIETIRYIILLGIIIFIYSVLVNATTFMQSPPRSNAEEINSIFMKLEYLGFLTEKYMRNTGKVPVGKMDFLSAIQLLKQMDKADEDPFGTKGFFVFIQEEHQRSRTQSEDLFFVLSERVMNYIEWPHYPKGEPLFRAHPFGHKQNLPASGFEKPGSFFSFGEIQACLFMRNTDLNDYLYVGLDSSLLNIDNNLQYSQMLSSGAPPGTYWSSASGANYTGGSPIFIQIRIPESLSNREAQ